MSATLRQTADESLVQEIDDSDEIGFDDHADRIIQEHQESRRGRPQAPKVFINGLNQASSTGLSNGVTRPMTTPAKSAAPPGSGMIGLPQLLEQQFASVQQMLAAHHEQALKLVEHFCSHEGLPGGPGVGGSLVSLVKPSTAPSSQWSQQQQAWQNPPPLPQFPMQLPEQQQTPVQMQPGPGASNLLDPSAALMSNGPYQQPGSIESPSNALALQSSADVQNSRKASSSAWGTGKLLKMDDPQRIECQVKAVAAHEQTKKDIQTAMLAGQKADVPKGPKATFPDAAQMKEKVKEAVMRPEYNVANFYKTKGIWQKIARTDFFDNLTLTIIAANAVWIAVDTDHNDSETLAEAHPFFQIGENAFCVYFAGELFIRFMAFKRKIDCMKDAWFVFDSALVFMMVMEYNARELLH